MGKCNIPFRNIKLTIEYDGTNYCGWQIQKGKHTIQSEIAKAIKRVTGKRVTLYGAGRTDGGVHALGQVANFKTISKIPISKIPHALNNYLSPDIIIRKANKVSQSFNSQFDAVSKTYCYTVLNRETPSALMRNTCYLVKSQLDIKKMRSAVKYIKGKRDFRAFATENKYKKNTIRCINSLSIKKDGDIITFKINGSGFLYNMVRAIVGTLIWVGLGKLAPKDVGIILNSCDRKNAGPNVPAKGLCLIEVKYNA